MELASKGPHDFYLTLDVVEYFEREYTVEDIAEFGFARALSLSERDVLVVAVFNDDIDTPVFKIKTPDQDALSAEERSEVLHQLGRILGADLDNRAFYEQVADDPVLAPLVEKHYGFKRLKRASFYEDAVRQVIRTRIAHEGTKKRMVHDVRTTWGTSFAWRGQQYATYPRPEVLAEVDPEQLRDFGISKRKGEYIVGLAKRIVDGELDVAEMEALDPDTFYERAQTIRGLGPSSAQTLMLRRGRSDASFPPHDIKGEEKGLRRWLLPRYGVDPDEAHEEEVAEVLKLWTGYESLVAGLIYYDWLMNQLEKQYVED
ncbi:MAG: hypothetical protein AAGI01_07565 [Myxococcota bacterium]